MPFRQHNTDTQRLKRAILGPFIGAREMGEPSLLYTNQIKLGICFFFFFLVRTERGIWKEEDGRHSRDSGLQTLWVIEPPHDSSSFFFFFIIYHSWELKGSFGVVCQPNELCQFSRFLSWCKVGTIDGKAWTKITWQTESLVGRIINKLSDVRWPRVHNSSHTSSNKRFEICIESRRTALSLWWQINHNNTSRWRMQTVWPIKLHNLVYWLRSDSGTQGRM